ncbi:MAG: hypothetical protein IKS07_10595 [Lachnospiraceae bacterium]|nr:hypothetical protein [Lachnospiraceae bacterium]
MKLTFDNGKEQLQYEIRQLKGISKDAQFGEYLDTIVYALEAPGADPGELRRQVIWNYRIYAQRMSEIGQSAEPMYLRAIYGDMDAPEVREVTPAAAPAQPVPQPVPVVQPAPQNTAAPQPVSTPLQAGYPSPEYVTATQYRPQNPENPPQAAVPQMQPQPQPIPQSQFAAQPQFAPQPQAAAYRGTAPGKPHNVEFAVGGIVLSIIGAVLVLAAGMMLAIHFLSSLAQGILLFAVCIGVTALSETLIRPRLPKLASVLTAIGISGLYLSTVVNYTSMHNFGLGVTLFLLMAVMVLTCFFGFVRKSFLYQIIGFLASYIAVSVITGEVSISEFYLVMGLTLLGNLLWVVFPARKEDAAFGCVMIAANTLFMLEFSLRNLFTEPDPLLRADARMYFVFASWVVLQIIYCLRGNGKGSLVSNIFYLCAAGLYGVRLMALLQFAGYPGPLANGLIVLAGLAFPAAFLLVYLMIRREERWPYAYGALLIVSVFGLAGTQNDFVLVFGLTFLIVLSRLLTRRKDEMLSMKIVDLILNCILFVLLLDTDLLKEIWWVRLVLLAAALFSLALPSGFTTVLQGLLTFGIIENICGYAPSELKLPIAMGLLCVALWVFNSIRSLRTRKVMVLNWISFAAEILFFIEMALHDKHGKEGLVLLICGIFGLVYVCMIMMKQFGFPFAGNTIVIAVYLAYVVLLLPWPSKAAASGALMAIAVVSVVLGAVRKQRHVRIYGLVLSLLVCLKLVFYDFFDSDALEKTLLYFVVGILALIISTVYFILERKLTKEAEPDPVLAAFDRMKAETEMPKAAAGSYAGAYTGAETGSAKDNDPAEPEEKSVNLSDMKI